MIDADGYRPNVGIILTNHAGQLFWARRVGSTGWQFPQGGIRPEESPEAALYRELNEEIGLTSNDVEVLGSTQKWLRYRLPRRYLRHGSQPLCIGQKQIWYLLRLVGSDAGVRFDLTDSPEFDSWAWVDYWQPVDEVIFFKRRVYEQALTELAPLVFPGDPPERRAQPLRVRNRLYRARRR